MTQDITVANSTMKIVREKVDFIFELTNTENGYTGSLHAGYGTRFSEVATILTRRGCILKSGHTNNPNYKWFNPTVAPTKNFYLSIAKEMVAKERERTSNWYKKHKKKTEAAKPVEEPAPAVAKEVEPPVVRFKRDSLHSYSIQELWNELKSRGCYIADGKLAQGVVTYFD